MVQVTLPSLPRGRITDQRTGQISQAWRQFFHDLWIRTGGGEDAVGDVNEKLVNITPSDDGGIVFVENGILDTDQDFFFEVSTKRVFFGGTTEATAKAIIASDGSIAIQDDDITLSFGSMNNAAISYDGTNLVINPKLVGGGFVNIPGELVVEEELQVIGNTDLDGDVVVAGTTQMDGDLEHTGLNLGVFGVTPTPVQTGYTTFANLVINRTLDADTTTLGEVADTLGTLIEDLKAKGLISA